MKIKELRIDFIDQLQAQYGLEETRSFFYILSEQFLELKRVEIALSLEKEVTKDQQYAFKNALEKLKINVPIQYIIGKTLFYNLPFLVNESVLIPRPETEELVHWIINDHKKTDAKNSIKILDIGTGSGCIAISLAKNIPNATVHAIDISDQALHIASENAKVNEVTIQFSVADILEKTDLKEAYDIIVSNPPYVRNLEKREIQPNVLEHEPAIALFVSDDDPLIFYRKITNLAKKHLRPKGSLYFEINQYLGKETEKMINAQGFTSVEVHQDLFDTDRMIKAEL